MLMKTTVNTKEIDLIGKLSAEELNDLIIHLGHKKQKNRQQSLVFINQLLDKKDQDASIYLADYLVAKEVHNHDIDLKHLINFYKKSDVIEALKTLVILDCLTHEDLDIDEELSLSEIVSDLENIIEDQDDKSLRELLVAYEFDLKFHSKIPNYVYRSYFLEVLGINSKSNSGDEIFLTSNYNLDLLNLEDQCPHEFIAYLKKAHAYINKPGPKEFNNWVILFEGESGLGKTAFAKWIAANMGQHFTYISFGSISSGFIGETEANIKKLFDDGRENKAIMYIDEADSVVFSRSNANQSFEVSITNEMLQQMEKYPGIVIMSTNLLEKMDHAVLRRFAQKITFNSLNPAQVLKAFEIYFKVKPTIKDKAILSKLKDLRLGDFQVVRQATMLKDIVTSDELIAKLGKEVAYRSRSEF